MHSYNIGVKKCREMWKIIKYKAKHVNHLNYKLWYAYMYYIFGKHSNNNNAVVMGLFWFDTYKKYYQTTLFIRPLFKTKLFEVWLWAM